MGLLINSDIVWIMANGKKRKKWRLLSKKRNFNNSEKIISILLRNRGIQTKRQKEEFLKPKKPADITLKEVKLSRRDLNKAINRLELAKKNSEKVLVYGDYDADGVCATAILWECLYKLGLDIMPHIPGRFDEGYGLNVKSIETLKAKYPDLGLIITVDNGIVATKAVDKANSLGIDVIITDHHQKEKKLPKALSIIHTTKIGGAGVAWILANEVSKIFQGESLKGRGLGLVAIGTVSDQISLTGANRSFVKYGLEELNKTKRVGILELYRESGIEKGSVSTYEIGFVIAPRINAMGRLENAIDSLRLLCTKNKTRANELALYLAKTNRLRQEIVEKVVIKTRKEALKRELVGAIVVSGEDYHEGVVGLAASKLVEEFYRPAIVLSKGKKVSKGSARSISGFNIINAIKKLDSLLLDSGGHPMAAGLSLETKNLAKFSKEFEKLTALLLSDKILEPILRIDLEIGFPSLSWDLIKVLKSFDPTGSGNPTPLFMTKKVRPWTVRTVGKDASHLKMKVEKDNQTFDVIGFGLGLRVPEITEGEPIDIAYVFEENEFNGVKSMQLRLKDFRCV